ncbi:MAG: ParB N-terminal domain-containing protein [Clostridia bacterium]|nr:ParB N-terminal domain-containing protein [Clostridia bacterium]
MKIEYLPVDSLTPYERNAKKHPDEQVEHIANSIREFGFRQPLVVDADNVVVIGHGRLMAAKKLGLVTVPVVRADDLSEAKIKALRLADNKTNESEWDFGNLNFDLNDLNIDFDMSDFGFDIAGGATEETSVTIAGQGVTEYREEDFGDDKFECECPRCGFKFNR